MIVVEAIRKPLPEGGRACGLGWRERVGQRGTVAESGEQNGLGGAAGRRVDRPQVEPGAVEEDIAFVGTEQRPVKGGLGGAGLNNRIVMEVVVGAGRIGGSSARVSALYCSRASLSSRISWATTARARPGG